MKRYLRRLWAALCGHTLGPVEIGTMKLSEYLAMEGK